MMNILSLLLLTLMTTPKNYSFTDIKNLYDEGHFKEAREKLDKAAIQNPEDEELFLRALLASDGLKSYSLFESLINSYPKSKHLHTSLFSISQYQFLNGNYKDAIQTLEKMRKNTPESEDSLQASLWIALSYIAMGDKKKAVLWYEKLGDSKLSTSPLAEPFLNHRNGKTKIYSIQVGSFTKKPTAIELVHSFKNKGYDTWLATTMKQGIKYYRVLVGEFDSKEKAIGFSRLFAEKEGIPFWIIGIKKL